MRLEYSLSLQDFIAAQRAHCWRKYQPSTARLFRAVQPLFAVFLIYFAYKMYREGAPSALVLIEAVCGFYLLLAPVVIAPWYYRRRYARTRRGNDRIILTFSDEGVSCEAPGVSHGSFEWTAFQGVLDRPEVTLLYLAPGVFVPLPRRVLTSEMHAEVLSVFRAKNIPFTYPKVKNQTA